jgi:hypothetical protein
MDAGVPGSEMPARLLQDPPRTHTRAHAHASSIIESTERRGSVARGGARRQLRRHLVAVLILGLGVLLRRRRRA